MIGLLIKSNQLADKPGSVKDSHLSRLNVTIKLKQPTLL